MSKDVVMSDSTDISIKEFNLSCPIVDLSLFFMIFSFEKDRSADADVRGNVNASLHNFPMDGKHSGSLRRARCRSCKDGLLFSASAFSIISETSSDVRIRERC